MSKIPIYFACLIIPILSPMLHAQTDSTNTVAYLDLLASRITADRTPMSEGTVWEASAAERHTRLMRMLGLNPLPEKTALNPRYVGDPVELEACTFQRVVIESSPGLFVAAHLYLPKGVRFPAPAVLYVPGHGRRDGYLRHPLAYASMGFVSIGLPMVGEEGRIDDDAGECGHYGPYHEQFDWYTDGYTSAGAEVWDTMRAVDFLLSLKTRDGTPQVDASRIGLAGISGGSARTFWAGAADPRITAAVACQGFTTVSNYNATIPSTCDVHLFYNYYHQSYAEVYGNIAPRALRVIQSTEDPLYKNPQPVADGLAQIYRVIGRPDQFSYVTFPGCHGYTPDVIAGEQAWLVKWLKPETPTLPKLDAVQRNRFANNRASLNDPKNLQCFTGNRQGWSLYGKPVTARSVRSCFTPKTPAPKISDEKALHAIRKELLAHLKEEVLRHAFILSPAELKLCAGQTREGLNEQAGTLLIDGVHQHACRYFTAPGKDGKTIVLLADGGVEAHLALARSLVAAGARVLAVETTRLKNKHLQRYAALVGHTSTSLAIQDALAAVRALRQIDSIPSDAIFIRGKGDAAVTALFAAVVDQDIAGVMLEDCPSQFSQHTALLGIHRHADLPRSAALLYPRPVVMIGTTPPEFNWTEQLYERLGRKCTYLKE